MKKLTLTIFTLLLLSFTFVSCANNTATGQDNDMVFLTGSDLDDWDDNASWSGKCSQSFTGDKDFLLKCYYDVTEEDLVFTDTPIVNEDSKYSPLNIALLLAFGTNVKDITEKDIPNPLEKGKYSKYAIGAKVKTRVTIKVNQEKTKLSMETKVTITKGSETVTIISTDTVTKD